MSSKLQSQAKWETSFPGFLHRQLIARLPATPPSTNFANKTAVISGSNTGLGYELARQMLFLQLPHLILAVRSQSKGESAARILRTEFPNATVEVMILDMTDPSSVVQFAKDCEKLRHLDIAILNAGVQLVAYAQAEKTKHELSLQVNYLSTVLLTSLLVPILTTKRRGPAPARLTVVGSDTMYWAKLPASLWDLDSPTSDASEQYMKTKLLLQQGITRLAESVDPDYVILNVANPGFCKGTNMGTSAAEGIGALLFGLFKKAVGRSIQDGARANLLAALAGEESHGSFVSEGVIKPWPNCMYTMTGRAAGERIWDQTVEELGLTLGSKN
ncbi:uncharacterized protein J7T54_007173 [Emericellopsis cladophorae]|uniref:Uncharacterized protein n=1 Tax=Emericellopsis cladophorae TaxID=2686198 RepID=A0A9P9Y917_9HYPO|nr:uncharacterized protein J7T54_007173 [Emericellopsis cladophorae]KAI6785530.1 hypothetical protein J7T54_007173 [Emericellopsis cladophorae]